MFVWPFWGLLTSFGHNPFCAQSMSEISPIFEKKFHTAFEFWVSWQAEFSYGKFLIITHEISHIFWVHICWNLQNCPILQISNLHFTFLRFSETPFSIVSANVLRNYNSFYCMHYIAFLMSAILILNAKEMTSKYVQTKKIYAINSSLE